MMGGADEAGRGPVFGPMVFAGVAADEKKLWNARDSKKCTRKKREELYKEISSVAERIEIIKIMPEEIDAMREKGKNLNAIELEAFCSIIERLGCDEIYIDSLGPGFERKIKEVYPKLKIIAECKADDRYKIVSAASIIAKVERDREMDEIAEELKEQTGLLVGSGYPSDEKTKVFLQRWFESLNSYPPHIRKSWLPARRYLNGKL
ncbi:MAG: ribonuclease HII [Candidatus Thermoplasmatota archaeon]|nr:ribonuclease HII [Candidatus Thermoplasmatota archaeon]